MTLEVGRRQEEAAESRWRTAGWTEEKRKRREGTSLSELRSAGIPLMPVSGIGTDTEGEYSTCSGEIHADTTISGPVVHHYSVKFVFYCSEM